MANMPAVHSIPMAAAASRLRTRSSPSGTSGKADRDSAAAKAAASTTAAARAAMVRPDVQPAWPARVIPYTPASTSRPGSPDRGSRS